MVSYDPGPLSLLRPRRAREIRTGLTRAAGDLFLLRHGIQQRHGDHDQSTHGNRYGGFAAGAASGSAAMAATRTEPPDEMAAAAMRNYTRNDYREVNGALREGAGQPPTASGAAAYYTRQTIAGMDRVFAESSGATEGIVVTRGVTDYRAMLGGNEPEVGMVYTDHGFVSTSTEDVARLGTAFTGGDNPMRMTIAVPEGTRAISSEPGVRDLLDPDEVVLDRGLSYRIVNDNGVDADGVRQIDVEVVRS